MTRPTARWFRLAVPLAFWFAGCATDMVAPRDQYRVVTIPATKEAVFGAAREVLYERCYAVTDIDIYAGVMEAEPTMVDSLDGIQRYRLELRAQGPDVYEVRMSLRVRRSSCGWAASSVPVPKRYLDRLESILHEVSARATAPVPASP